MRNLYAFQAIAAAWLISLVTMCANADVAPQPYSEPQPYVASHPHSHRRRHHRHVEPPVPLEFPAPYPVLASDYYQSILSSYEACLTDECDFSANHNCSADSSAAPECMGDISSYTACVTACASAGLRSTVSDLRSLLRDIATIGYDRLQIARQYVSNDDYEFDVLGNRTRVGSGSCVLPREYFAPWSSILIPVQIPVLSPPPTALAAATATATATATTTEADTDTTSDTYRDADWHHHQRQRHRDVYDDVSNDDEDAAAVESIELTGTPSAKTFMIPAVTYVEHCSRALAAAVDPAAAAAVAAHHHHDRHHHHAGGMRAPWIEFLTSCDATLVKYLQHLQRNLGNLILTPDAAQVVLPGSCTSAGGLDASGQHRRRRHHRHRHLKSRTRDTSTRPFNPVAESFPDDVCVASTYEIQGQSHAADAGLPLIKPIITTTSSQEDHQESHVYDHAHARGARRERRAAAECPSDVVAHGAAPLVIHYTRQAASNVSFWSVTTGLPSRNQPQPIGPAQKSHDALVDALTAQSFDCAFTQGLATSTDTFFDAAETPLNSDTIEAAWRCPGDSLLEFSSMQQYAAYLEFQLFDHSACSLDDLASASASSTSSSATLPPELSLACLYKVFTLKSDCMRAVVNCYAHDDDAEELGISVSLATDALSRTLRRPASILVGLVLCQQPNVFALFGGDTGVDQSTIMRALLHAATDVDLDLVDTNLHMLHEMVLPTLSLVLMGLGLTIFRMMKPKHETTPTGDIGLAYRELI